MSTPDAVFWVSVVWLGLSSSDEVVEVREGVFERLLRQNAAIERSATELLVPSCTAPDVSRTRDHSNLLLPYRNMQYITTYLSHAPP